MASKDGFPASYPAEPRTNPAAILRDSVPGSAHSARLRASSSFLAQNALHPEMPVRRPVGCGS